MISTSLDQLQKVDSDRRARLQAIPHEAIQQNLTFQNTRTFVEVCTVADCFQDIL